MELQVNTKSVYVNNQIFNSIHNRHSINSATRSISVGCYLQKKKKKEADEEK